MAELGKSHCQNTPRVTGAYKGTHGILDLGMDW